ncbi:S1 RNA-binding domain-containing protein 1 [Prorops nasuta]|uniref:S1 RNA-binding domain-containing protein 1 n=1 Tax=Prorops nasuta TaxID=863751 RepID=UPI0034CD5D2B
MKKNIHAKKLTDNNTINLDDSDETVVISDDSEDKNSVIEIAEKKNEDINRKSKKKTNMHMTVARQKRTLHHNILESSKYDKLSRKKRKVIHEKEDNESGAKQTMEKINVCNVEKMELNNIPIIEYKDWTEVDYISESYKVDKVIAQNIIQLFENENTVPFIARYRKHITGNLTAEQLFSIKVSYEEVKVLKKKAINLIKTIDKLGKWTPEIHATILSVKSMDDLEHISSFYRCGGKRSLAERARELGLEVISKRVLQGIDVPNLNTFINTDKEGLKTEQQVRDGVIHILADTISKNKNLFDKLKVLQETIKDIEIRTKVNNEFKELKNNKNKVEKKYEMYYDFKVYEALIKPHQILAINRAESLKILNVKINIPDNFEFSYRESCMKEYKKVSKVSNFHLKLLNDSIDYAYKKFVKPLIVRRIRSKLKEKAETASIQVFATNVKQLLLISPVRGKVILGIDPGFYHGCKLAVISETGNVLETGVIYPHHNQTSTLKARQTLINLIEKYKCTLIALGNATACRETELFLTNLIESKAFNSLEVMYTIVDEAGSSIYSCSSEAKSEYPNLDPTVISAISIAKRVQDPLAELVKVEPKHLGVGMYQHDLPEKQLILTLNEVISEAVSFVGVDVNTASQCLLKRVAGLSMIKATNILEWRNKKGPFINRKQLMDVKGIGAKTFEQCAGFIRILPETSLIKNLTVKNTKSPNPLDQTWIHPESYKIATKFIKDNHCNINEIGSEDFIQKFKSYSSDSLIAVAQKYNTDITTMEIIVKGLSMKKDEDIRLKSTSPIFQNNTKSMSDLYSGLSLTGVVRNITSFGAFVDVGVGRSGLVPIQYIRKYELSVGQRVLVKVCVLDISRNRFSLEIENLL